MKSRNRTIITISILILIHGAMHAGTVVADWMHLNGMLSSIAAEDYNSFCSHGSPALKTNISKDDFTKIVSSLRPILLAGYNLEESGYNQKSLNNIFVTWTLYPDRDKPKMVLRVDFDAPGGRVTKFKTE